MKLQTCVGWILSVCRGGVGIAAAAVLGLGLGACSYQSRHMFNECPFPDRRLLPAWEQWREVRAKPGGCESSNEGRSICEELRREVERIAHVCPTYVPGFMASAILAYEDRQFALAQQYLDALFRLQKVHGSAAVLRGRLALEEGNIPFALRFLAEHVKLSPEDPELREVYAGALFLADKLPEAKRQLTMAANLGAPAWRVAYHQGLFEEASGNFHLALGHYEEAIKERPGWDLALARRDGILAAIRDREELGITPDGDDRR